MRLLLIEDSQRLQESLCAGFRRAGFAVDAVGDGERGLVFAKRGLYDVILLDLKLPDVDGLDLLRRLRSEGSDAHVLILTAKHTVEDRVRGLQSGADDYVPKPFSFDELLARVQALIRRRYQSKDPAICIGDVRIDTVARRVSREGADVRLTKREYRILEYLARRRGETVSRMEIEDHIYGEENLPGSNAVESAMSVLRKKLDEAGPGKANLIHTRHGVGYCLDETSP